MMYDILRGLVAIGIIVAFQGLVLWLMFKYIDFTIFRKK